MFWVTGPENTKGRGGGAEALGREREQGRKEGVWKGSWVGPLCLLTNQPGNRESWELPGL